MDGARDSLDRTIQPSPSPMARAAWFALGMVSLCVGAIGVVVPLLPTTPLLLVAAYCFLRSSRRMHEWIMTNRVFGSYIRGYSEGRGISARAKAATVAILWLTLGVSSFMFRDDIVVLLILLAVGVVVTAHVIMIGPRRKAA